MTILIVVVAVVLALALWLELREWRRPRSSDSKSEGPDEMRHRFEHDHLGTSFRGGYRRGDNNRP